MVQSRDGKSIFSAGRFSPVSCREPACPPWLFVRPVEPLYVRLPLAPNCPCSAGCSPWGVGKGQQSVTRVRTAITAPRVPAAGRRMCWIRCRSSLRSPSETKDIVESGRVCAGSQGRWGTPAWCPVRVHGGACGLSQSHRAGVYQQHGGVVLDTPCLGLSALSRACWSGAHCQFLEAVGVPQTRFFSWVRLLASTFTTLP